MPVSQQTARIDETVSLWNERITFQSVLGPVLEAVDEAEENLPMNHLKTFHGTKLYTPAHILKYVTPYPETPDEHKVMLLNAELIDVLIERESAETACDWEGLLEKQSWHLQHDWDLEQAILDSTPTTIIGLARKLRAINEYPYDDDGKYMAAFLLELENFEHAA